MKISELEELYANTVDGGESFPLISYGKGYRMKLSEFQKFVKGGFDIGEDLNQSAGKGLTYVNGKFHINVGYEKNGDNYPVQLSAEGKPFVNVPYTGGSSGGGITSIKINKGSSNVGGRLLSSLTASGDTIRLTEYSGSVGDEYHPMYLSVGVPMASKFRLATDVSEDAKLTDEKVTSEENHYTPITKNRDYKADATSPASYGSTSVVTGLIISSDSKGHITGIALSSAYLPEVSANNVNADDVISELWGDDTSTKGKLLVKTDYAGDSYRISEFTGDVGSSKIPIYINNGVPTALNYNINKSVPSNALFTDESTTYDGHYTPSESGTVKISSDASQVDCEVITGITLSHDGKGHLIGLNIAATNFPSPATASNKSLGVVQGNYSLSTKNFYNGSTQTTGPLDEDITQRVKLPVKIDGSGNMYVELNLGSSIIMDGTNSIKVGSKINLQ